MIRGALVDSVRTLRRHWWRLALVQVALLVGMLIVVTVIAVLLQDTVPDLLAWLSADAELMIARITGLVAVLAGVIALLVTPLSLGSVIATAAIADRSLAGVQHPARGLIRVALARFFPLLGTLALVLVAGAFAFIAAPIVVLIGLLGLSASGMLAIVRRVARGRVTPPTWWPSWRFWGLLAIPFALLGRVASIGAVAPTLSVLAPAAPMRAIRAAETAVRGRRLQIIAVWAASLVVVLGLVFGAFSLGSLLFGEPGGALFSMLTQFVALPIPTVILVALVRRATDAGPGVSPGVLAPRRASTAVSSTASPAAASATPRIASVTIAALVLSVGLVATPTSAAVADAPAVVITVTSNADTLEPTDLDAQQQSCLVIGPDCTIRAALAVAQQAAADGAASATITFGSSMEIALADTLRFEPDWVPAEPGDGGEGEGGDEGEGEGESGGGGGQSVPSAIVPGALVIDTDGQRVVLDGGDAVQILYVASEAWNLGIAGLTFQNGTAYSQFAGALLAGVPSTEIRDSVFDSNTASAGAGAIFARELVVSASSFINNHASGTNATTSGGAIRTAGRATLENTTFGGNRIGDQFSPRVDNGIDVYAEGGVDVVNSSFVNSQGGAISTPSGASSSIRNSVFTTDWTGGGLACSGGGDYTGGPNASGQGDLTCPGTDDIRHDLVSGLDEAGVVPVYPLQFQDNPAMGAGVECPAVDALGAARAVDGCDLGAVEFGMTRLDLTVEPDAVDYGTATFVATVVHTSPSAFAASVTGSVAFTVDGVEHDPVSVNGGVARLTVERLGGAIEYSAVYLPDAPFDASSAGPLTHTIDQVPVVVALACAEPTASACDGEWAITEAESIDLVATVADDGRPGTIVLASDPDGDAPLSDAVAVVDGAAAFTLDGSVLGFGAHPVYAVYESDDSRYAGIAEVRTLHVRLQPTVSITGPAIESGDGAVFGDRGAGTITVTVSGAGTTPTGSVTVASRTVQLVDGIATIDLSRLAVSTGASALVADYSGDSGYVRGASDPVSFSTTAATTTTQIVGMAPAAPEFGQNVSVQVEVVADAPSDADPRGSVVVSVDGEPYVGVPDDSDGLDDGTRTFAVAIPASVLETGSRNVQARFTGNGDFENSLSATASLTVIPASTATRLTVAPTESTWGDQVTLTAEVSTASTASTPAGSVAFMTGSATLGTAVLSACPSGDDGCAIATLAVSAATIGLGAADVTARYDGETDFAASTSASVDVTVAAATPTVTVTGPGSVAYGTGGSIGITVTAGSALVPDGSTVTVSAVPTIGSSIPLGTVSLIGGAATVTIPSTALLPGDYTVVASFAGDEHILAASGSIAHAVTEAATDLALTVLSETDVVFGATEQATLEVKNTSGTLAPDGHVVVLWAGIEVGRVELTAANDTSTPGLRRVTVDVVFDGAVLVPGSEWLTARFEPAVGFAATQLSSDFPEERRMVSVAPLEASVSVEVAAVIGSPIQATATVAIIGDDRGITPAGSVQFVIIANGVERGTTPSIPLVNGVAEMPATILVDAPGTWTARAIYAPPVDERRYVSTAPNHIGFAATEVDAGSAIVEVTAPDAVPFGEPLMVTVVVRAAIVAQGTVRIDLAGAGNTALSDEVTLVDGRAEITTTLSPFMTVGDHTFAVAYSGGGGLDAVKSAEFTVATGPTPTTLTVTTSSLSTELVPGIVGATVEYTAKVSGPVGRPSSIVPAGIVTFTRGATVIGQVVPNSTGFATLAVVADVAWTGDITAEFVPTDTRFAGSSATLAHSWVIAPVTVAITAPQTSVIGEPASVTAVVRFDSTGFESLPTALLPMSAPSGAVTITGSGGEQCVASATPLQLSAPGVWPVQVSTQWSTATCSLDFLSLGDRELAASYPGDGRYGAATASAATNVAKGTPTVTVDTPDGTEWLGLTSIPIVWAVDGPASGAVSVSIGSTVVCTSSSLVGSCLAEVPRFSLGGGAVVMVEVQGSALWNAAVGTRAGAITACIPAAASTGSPTSTATVAITPSPTCGNGTGYFTSDIVAVAVTATLGHQIETVSTQGIQYPNDQLGLTADRGAAAIITQPVLRVTNGQARPFGIDVTTSPRCVPVTFAVTGITDRATALSMLRWSADVCAGTPSANTDTSVTAMLRVGSQVSIEVQSALMPQHREFAGWSGTSGEERFAPTATYTVAATDNRITAAFGSVCYSGLPDLEQPDRGILTVTPPATNCVSPRTGIAGWTYNTPASGQLVDDATTARVFLQAWTGDTERIAPGVATTSVDADGVRSSTRPFTFRITDQTFTVGATYGECFAVSTRVIGDTADGVPGTASVSTAANCPIANNTGSSASTERWFRSGSSVTVTTVATAGSTLKLLGWSGLDLPAAKLISPTVTAVITADTVATAAYAASSACNRLDVTTVPAGQITLDTTFDLGENACAVRYGANFYDQGLDGNGVSMNASAATPEADGAEFVYAWATSPVGAAQGASPSIGNTWTQSSQLGEVFYGRSTVLVYACQFVAVAAHVFSPDGELVPEAGAANIDVASKNSLTDFVLTKKANCSTGADPTTGFGGYAWVVGTQLLPMNVADPRAYEFTGWSGDVTGMGETADAPVSLVGVGNRGATSEFHREIVANYQAICYRFETTAVSPLVDVLTEPNCPGVDPSENLYLGGTEVVMHANNTDDVRFRGWSETGQGFDGPDFIDTTDPRWASITMTKDMFVGPKFSPPTIGETATKAADTVGNQLAIAGKKLVGLAAAAGAAAFKTVFAEVLLVAALTGYVADGLKLAGVHGSAIDTMKLVSTSVTSMMNLLWAPMDCVTVWSAGGDNNMIYYAQNFIGSQMVASLTAEVPKPAEAGADVLEEALADLAKQKEKLSPLIMFGEGALAAKDIYEAAEEGRTGWENSAYDAWVAEASYEVYAQCMAGKTGAALTVVDTVLK